MSEGKRKILFSIIVLIFFIFIFFQYVTPYLISLQIERDMMASTEQIENLEVKVDSFPPWKYFYSRIDYLLLKADIIEIDGLLLEDLEAEYENVVLEEDRIKGQNTDLTLTITEEQLNKYLQQIYPRLRNINITLQSGEVFVDGFITISDTEINISLQLEIVIRERTRILFIPQNIKVEELTIPQFFVEGFLEEEDFSFSFDLKRLNFPLNPERTLITDGKLFLISGRFSERIE